MPTRGVVGEQPSPDDVDAVVATASAGRQSEREESVTEGRTGEKENAGDVEKGKGAACSESDVELEVSSGGEEEVEPLDLSASTNLSVLQNPATLQHPTSAVEATRVATLEEVRRWRGSLYSAKGIFERIGLSKAFDCLDNISTSILDLSAPEVLGSDKGEDIIYQIELARTLLGKTDSAPRNSLDVQAMEDVMELDALVRQLLFAFARIQRFSACFRRPSVVGAPSNASFVGPPALGISLVSGPMLTAPASPIGPCRGTGVGATTVTPVSSTSPIPQSTSSPREEVQFAQFGNLSGTSSRRGSVGTPNSTTPRSDGAIPREDVAAAKEANDALQRHSSQPVILPTPNHPGRAINGRGKGSRAASPQQGSPFKRLFKAVRSFVTHGPTANQPNQPNQPSAQTHQTNASRTPHGQGARVSPTGTSQQQQHPTTATNAAAGEKSKGQLSVKTEVQGRCSVSSARSVGSGQSTPRSGSGAASTIHGGSILCRVCENRVELRHVSTHSKLCADNQANAQAVRTCDKKLVTCITEMKQYAQTHHLHLSPAAEGFLRDAVTIARKLESTAYGASDAVPRCEEAEAATMTLKPKEFTDAVGPSLRNCLSTLQQAIQLKIDILRRGDHLVKSVTEGVLPAVEAPARKLKKRRKPVSIDDFDVLGPISRGGIGRVFLARKRPSQDLVAIKVLSKEEVVRRGLTEKVMLERNIQALMSRNDHMVRFYYSFSSAHNLYMVSAFMPGGDLFSLLQAREVLSLSQARQVAAELVLAVEFLHQRSVIHRDIKPDNILLDAEGHIRLTDFGLSDVAKAEQMQRFTAFHDYGSGSDSRPGTFGRRVSVVRAPRKSILHPMGELPSMPAMRNRASSNISQDARAAVRGTPDYIAPELLLGLGHTGAVDWWAVGIIVYEMLVGIPPFNEETPQRIFDGIIVGKVDYPEDMDPDAKGFIEGLLQSAPANRLGSAGTAQLKIHPFFKGLDWAKVKSQPTDFKCNVEEQAEAMLRAFEARQQFFPMSEKDIGIISIDQHVSDSSSDHPPAQPTSTGNSLGNDSAFGTSVERGSPFATFSLINPMNLADLTIKELEGD